MYIPFSWMTLSTRDGRNPIPMREHLKLVAVAVADELATLFWNSIGRR